MLLHTNHKQLFITGKASEVKQALASIKKEATKNETLQQYLLQRPTMSIKVHINSLI